MNVILLAEIILRASGKDFNFCPPATKKTVSRPPKNIVLFRFYCAT